MIRQICLNCYKMTELPDDSAGKQVTCPNCNKPMDVPAKFTPGVAAGGGMTSVPPPPVPPTANSGASPMSPEPLAPPTGLTPPPGTVVPTQGPPPMPYEYAGGVGFRLNPVWLAWVPLGCLVAVFVLSFFAWAKLAPGGYTVLTQNGWEAAFGSHSGTVPELQEWKDLEKAFVQDNRLRWDGLMFVYILLLLPTIALVVIERVVNPQTTKLPGPLLWIPRVWPYLLFALAGLSLLLFLLVFFASLRGFGLERAVADVAQAKYQEQLDKNPAGTELRKIHIQVGQDAARFAPLQTIWVNLLLCLHLLAVLALLTRIWLNTRPNKPHPRIGVQW